MNRKGVREEFMKGSGRTRIIVSIFVSILIIGSLAVSSGKNNSIGSTSFNQSKLIENPLSEPTPLNWNEANWYKETGLGDRGRFTVIWTTKGEYTGTVKYSTTSDFDPTSTGFTKTDARGDENYVDDTHYVDVDRVPHDGSMVYYYVESDGTYYGRTATGEFAPYPIGNEIAITTPTHKNADGPVTWYPVCGHLLYEGQVPPEGADYEIAIGWFYDGSGTHGGASPKYPIADITDYSRAWVGGASAEPDNRHGGYNFDTVWILKTEAGDAEWMPVAGDAVTVKGYGAGNENGVSYGNHDNYTLVYGYDTGTDLVPDIILCSPPPTLIANFTVEPDDSPCSEPAVWDNVYFNSTSYGGSTSREDLYYEWDFGDGETAVGYGYDGYDNVTHEYYVSGIYAVTLKITDDDSPPSSDTITKDVKIWPNRVSTTPLDVREASVKGIKADVCWHTCINTTGYVIWGSSPDILDNTATDMKGDENYTDDTHICRITGLTEYTKYYYKVISGSKTYDDFSQPFNYTTGRDFIYPPSPLIRGYVYKSDGVTPADGVLVYMYMEKPNGDKSLLECVYTNSDGRYTKEKRDFRSSGGEHMFEYTTGTDWIDQFAEGATDGTANQTVILTEDDPQWALDMVLSGTPPDKTAPTSTAGSPAENTTGTWDVYYTADDDCKGLDSVELWYNYTPDAALGSVYTYYATDDYAGEVVVEGCFAFSPSNGTGYYHFYTRGMDIAGNYEPVPKEPDCTTHYKGTPPGAPTNISAKLEGANLEDVNITWTLSKDDGGGENDVIGYDVYHNMTYNKDKIGYTLLANVSSGVSYFVHRNAGDGNPNHYFYYVVAKDKDGNTAATKNQAGKIAKRCVGGCWNFISNPLLQEDTDIITALQSLEWDIARWYNPLDQLDHWETYAKFKSDDLNDLCTINRTMGLWVNVTKEGEDHLVDARSILERTTIQLYKGWNLVSYPSFIKRTVGDALSGIPYDQVEGFNGSRSPYYLEILSDDALMEADNGYWVHVISDCVWTVYN